MQIKIKIMSKKNKGKNDKNLSNENLDIRKEVSEDTLVVQNPSDLEEKEARMKLQKLEEMVDASLKEYIGKREGKSGPALMAKVITSFMSAVITVLLGLNLGSFNKENPALFSNIALGISAFMTVIAVWNSFHDYNDLYSQYTKIAANLEILQKELEYLKEGNPSITMEDVEERKEKYFEALQDTANFLVSVKSNERES